MQDLIVHGFCKGFKTSTSIMLEVMRDIFQSRYLRSNVAHKQLPRMSLSAAFNTIDHQILLNVLENDFGITASALDWFASYLSDRKQRVLIRDQSSGDFQLNCGDPQATVWVPFCSLFLFLTIFSLFISMPMTRISISRSGQIVVFHNTVP